MGDASSPSRLLTIDSNLLLGVYLLTIQSDDYIYDGGGTDEEYLAALEFLRNIEE
jgi:hypothetical protein